MRCRFNINSQVIASLNFLNLVQVRPNRSSYQRYTSCCAQNFITTLGLLIGSMIVAYDVTRGLRCVLPSALGSWADAAQESWRLC